MKTVAIISTITFAVIFGLIVLTTGLLGELTSRDAVVDGGDDRVEASDRLFADLAVERDRVQRETERLLTLRESLQLEQQMVDEHYRMLEAMIDSLDAAQRAYGQEREESAAKLAKVYEAMKADQAAEILAGLEIDVVMDVLGRMKDRQAARILGAMNAGLAAQISRKMSLKGDRG